MAAAKDSLMTLQEQAAMKEEMEEMKEEAEEEEQHRWKQPISIRIQRRRKQRKKREA